MAFSVNPEFEIRYPAFPQPAGMVVATSKFGLEITNVFAKAIRIYFHIKATFLGDSVKPNIQDLSRLA